MREGKGPSRAALLSKREGNLRLNQIGDIFSFKNSPRGKIWGSEIQKKDPKVEKKFTLSPNPYTQGRPSSIVGKIAAGEPQPLLLGEDQKLLHKNKIPKVPRLPMMGTSILKKGSTLVRRQGLSGPHPAHQENKA